MGNGEIVRVNTIQSIERALTILEILPDGPEEGLGITEIAERLNLPKSTAHRIVFTLVQRGFVFQDGEKGKYRIGYKILEISRRILNNISMPKLVTPYLEKLAEVTGETAGFAVVHKEEARITLVNEVISKNPVRACPHLDETISLKDTACGRIYLSMLSHDRLEHLIAKTGRNMVFSGGYESLNTFKEELVLIKRQGYACNSKPDSECLMAVAAAIMNETGEPAGIIEVYGPSYRMSGEVIEKYGPIVKDVANEFSAKIGFIGTPNGR